MIIMTTLRDIFPKIWECDTHNKTAYFSTSYLEQKNSIQHILNTKHSELDNISIGRYSSLKNQIKQNFPPSLLYITSMNILKKKIRIMNIYYDFEVKFKFICKISDENLIKNIESIYTTPLIQNVEIAHINLT
ncbi:MAG: hypothetical protein J1E80_05530 [Desulfovibrionaceae bacterium]|nr:hypothetical protein [Desulfovibrionaceae bacterium]